MEAEFRKLRQQILQIADSTTIPPTPQVLTELCPAPSKVHVSAPVLCAGCVGVEVVGVSLSGLRGSVGKSEAGFLWLRLSLDKPLVEL